MQLTSCQLGLWIDNGNMHKYLCHQEIMVIPMMWIMWDIYNICAQKFSVINTILQCLSDTVLQFGDTYYFVLIAVVKIMHSDMLS